MLINNINYVASYTILHNSMHILNKKLPRLSVIEEVSFISQKTKCNTCWLLQTIEKYINPVFYI